MRLIETSIGGKRMSEHNRLQAAICVHLATIHAPTKKGFAGMGQSRRRERSSAVSIAKSTVASIRVNHRIERGGVAVDDAEVVELLATELWRVPEELAKDLVGIDAHKRESAREAIGHNLLLALTGDYECTFFTPEYHGMKESLANIPGSAFYQGRT
jgi:hypothetical protein